MAFEETSGGLGGLGGFMSGLGNKLGSNDMLTALALMDAGRARVNPPPLAQTLAPIMALQEKAKERQAQQRAITLALIQSGVDPKLAAVAGADPHAAKMFIDQATLKRQSDFSNEAADLLQGGQGIGGLVRPSGNSQRRSDASPADPEIENRFVSTLQQGGLTNPNGLAAVAAYGNAESRYSPSNVARAWSDPSESGQPGTSGGLLSWRDDRLDNMRKFTAGADDPVAAQAQFMLAENPELTKALQNAKSPEEAHDLMANAWKFAGYDRPGGEYQRRLDLTKSYAQRFAGNATPGHLTEPPPMNLGAASDAPAAEPFAWQNTSTKEAADAQDAERLRQLTQGTGAPTQIASADPNFVPLPPQRPAGLGDDGKPPSQVLIEQQRAREANGPRVAQNQAGTMSDAGSPLLNQNPADVVRLANQIARKAMDPRADAAARQALLDERKRLLDSIAPTAKARELVEAGFVPGTPEYREAYRRQLTDNRPEAMKLADQAGLQGQDRSTALTGAIPGNAPTSTMKQAEADVRAQGLRPGMPGWDEKYRAALEKYANAYGGIANTGPIPPGRQIVQENGAYKMVAIPGSPAEQEDKQTAEKERLQQSQQKTSSDIVTQDIDRALDLAKTSKLPVTGMFGSRLAGVPGTAAHDVQQSLMAIKSNIAFDRLQQMRASSPTGGALGAVSDAEGKLLQAAYGSLEQSQTEAQFERNLKRLRTLYVDIIHGGESNDKGGSSEAKASGGASALAAARDAISKGAPRDAVIKRLRENGIDPKGL